MLQICSDGHDPVVHEDGCPACKSLSEKSDSDQQCSAALAQIDELKQEVRDLQEKLSHAECKIEEQRGTIDMLNDKLANAKFGDFRV